MKIKDLIEAGGVGKITKYNTTVDVKPGETERQAKKLFPMNKSGKPMAMSGSSTHKAFNLGLVKENLSVTGTERRRLEKKKGIEIGSPEWFKHWFDLPYLREGKGESYLLQLERDYDNDMLVLHVLDNRSKHRTEVRGKLGYESGNYDPDDKLHKILDDIGKAANMSELMNGEVVSINPRHPDGERAKAVAKQLTREDISTVDLQQLEKFADKLFGKVGIDVEFTRHFLDRVNDVRNQKPITMSELTRLFKQEYKRWGKPIAQMGPDQEAVMKDLQTDINLPFALRWDEKNQELDLIAKTIMRKKGFRTPNQEFPVENAPGSIASKINWGGQNKPVKKNTSQQQQDPNQLAWWQRLKQRVMGEEEVQEETPWSMLKRKAGHAVNAPQYVKAATFLHHIIKRKHKETNGNLRHSLGYYAQMIASQTGDKLNWRELQDEYLRMFGNEMFENFADGKEKVQPTNEAFDNPYPITWEYLKPTGASSAIGKVEDGSALDIHISEDPDGIYEIEFARGQSNKNMGRSGQGDEFRIFATVQNAMLEWWEQLDKTKARKITFYANKEDGNRARLYKRFLKMWGDKSEWDIEVNSNVKPGLVAYTLTNPISDEPKNDKKTFMQRIFGETETVENFKDGKVKGKSRPGRVKRAGASCDGSVTELRRKAKNSSGEKQKMYHWCANMKSGKKK